MQLDHCLSHSSGFTGSSGKSRTFSQTAQSTLNVDQLSFHSNQQAPRTPDLSRRSHAGPAKLTSQAPASANNRSSAESQPQNGVCQIWQAIVRFRKATRERQQGLHRNTGRTTTSPDWEILRGGPGRLWSIAAQQPTPPAEPAQPWIFRGPPKNERKNGTAPQASSRQDRRRQLGQNV